MVDICGIITYKQKKKKAEAPSTENMVQRSFPPPSTQIRTAAGGDIFCYHLKVNMRGKFEH
jgi:hypothetical protein